MINETLIVSSRVTEEVIEWLCRNDLAPGSQFKRDVRILRELFALSDDPETTQMPLIDAIGIAVENAERQQQELKAAKKNRTCEKRGCEGRYHAQGLCIKHYMRKLRAKHARKSQ